MAQRAKAFAAKADPGTRVMGRDNGLLEVVLALAGLHMIQSQ